jgi:Restriction endonuclease
MYFINNVLKDFLVSKGALFEPGYIKNNLADLDALIIEVAKVADENELPNFDISNVRDGLDYEEFVRSKFKEAGWHAWVTKASGDQGADVVIELDGVRAVVQCKYYATAVGNDAVQQVAAARPYYCAQYAVVVSKSDYTESARELARPNKVSLIHHDEIPQLFAMLQEENDEAGVATNGSYAAPTGARTAETAENPISCRWPRRWDG